MKEREIRQQQGMMIGKTREWKGICEKGGQDIKVRMG